ncbi:CLUMA_CG004332, isoform A [Clunio marinus]|uniref:Chitinase domain-containing protein 1 n=1 Tax=Clunio marinus TaxID=568069 RepID=A0A1J1HVU3_9DIPT|nr:CLUMA_CG004332, isoform A [Clunio marinus]
MKIIFSYILLILLISCVSSTLNPSKNKKGKTKSSKQEANFKVNKGPQEQSVYERNLVNNEPLASDIISEAHTYYKDTSLKNFNGTVLGYVTPWNSHGYDVAKIFGPKLNIISPVWLQIMRISDQKYEITGTHDIDKGWMKEVREKGKITKFFPRILFEHFTDKDYSKLLTYHEEINAAVQAIITTCKKYNFDGVVLELWSQLAQRVDDHHLINLVKSIGSQLKTVNIGCILVIPPSQRGPDIFNEDHFDQLWEDVTAFSLMTYDFSSYQRPGANAPLYWMKRVVEHITHSTEKLQEKRAKILLGLNFYGYDFTPEGGEAVVAETYLSLLKHVKGRLKFDEKDHENYFEVKTSTGKHLVFYPTLYSIQQRIDLAHMNRFSTKNPYSFTHQTFISYPNFEPKKIWSILRHGTRLPSKKVISKYQSLVHIRDELLENSTLLSDQQRHAFKNWKPMDIQLEHQKFITKEGEQEHLLLGTRFRKRFPTFFKSMPSLTFKHTPTQRTQKSAEKFIQGLFPANGSNIKPIVVDRDDPVLRPYKGCSLWRKTVKKNKDVSLKEKRNFQSSELVDNVVNEFRSFTQIDHLTIDDIELIYTMCGFESSWNYKLFNGRSVWCSLFTNENHFKIMEFLEDLEYYWIDGYGYEITKNVACKTVNDIFINLDPSIDEKKATFYFTHSGTILKLLTSLGLYKDDYDLTAENFHDDRQWKTSIIDSFSSNIVVILYESKQGPYVQLLHQEQIVNLPKCHMNQYGMCPYEVFEELYNNKAKHCNLSELCHVKDEL